MPDRSRTATHGFKPSRSAVGVPGRSRMELNHRRWMWAGSCRWTTGLISGLRNCTRIPTCEAGVFLLTISHLRRKRRLELTSTMRRHLFKTAPHPADDFRSFKFGGWDRTNALLVQSQGSYQQQLPGCTWLGPLAVGRGAAKFGEGIEPTICSKQVYRSRPRSECPAGIEPASPLEGWPLPLGQGHQSSARRKE